MPSARLLPLAVLLFVLVPETLAEGKRGCYASAGEQSVKIHGFTIRVFRHPQADQQAFLDECKAEIRGASGGVIFSDEDHGLEILPISGTDINGDGEPEAVIEGYSGGAHCC